MNIFHTQNVYSINSTALMINIHNSFRVLFILKTALISFDNSVNIGFNGVGLECNNINCFWKTFSLIILFAFANTVCDEFVDFKSLWYKLIICVK